MARNNFFIGILVLVFLAAVYFTITTGPSLAEAPTISALAPDFTLQSLSGETVSLSDHRGKVVLINFWATWCPPCRQEMPDIQERYARYAPDLVVLAVNNDETADLVAAFVDAFDLTFDPLLDPGAEVQTLYQLSGYPTSFFIDRDGVIQIIKVGFMTAPELDGYLASLGIGVE